MSDLEIPDVSRTPRSHAYTAKRLHQLGAVLVAVSTAAGWIYDPPGSTWPS